MDTNSLHTLEAFLISDILDHCLRQIKILGEVSLFSKKENLSENDNNFVDLKDNEELSSTEDDAHFLHSVKEITSTEKLKHDRTCIQTALADVVQELMNNRTYETIKCFNETYKEKQREVEAFHTRTSEQQQLIPKLRNDLANAEKATEEKLDDIDKSIGELNFEFQKLKAHFSMEKSYLRKECANNIERTKKMCDLRKQEVKNNIKHLMSRLVYEDRSDDEIAEYWQQDQKELLEVLDYWKAKYFDHQLFKEQEIRTLQKYKDCNLKKSAKVAEKLKAAEDVLEEARLEKEEERKRIEHEKEMIKAAIMLQAWWRGTMVRKKLGPYAPKKKEKKGKKGKKGKKKK